MPGKLLIDGAKLSASIRLQKNNRSKTRFLDN